MIQIRPQQRDPLASCVFIALLFVVVAWHRLALPSEGFFDEVHYIPAARKLLHLIPANREHPMLGKEIIAASIALLGDKPLGWRLPSLIFGGFGLFAFGRLMWWLSGRRFATLAAMVLLASDFTWFIQSRIAMLDMFAATLLLAALWQFAVASHAQASRTRLHLAISGICLGLALGSKWSVLPVIPLPGLAFLILHLRANVWRPALKNRSAPGGVSLLEAAFWLGLLPLVIYWATFAPAFFYAPVNQPVSPLGFIEQHRHMIELQDSVIRQHPYQSVWYQWIVNWRPIWYLYEYIDDAQRGVLLLGNPFTMIAGLPALIWCAWTGMRHRQYAALALAVLYIASLGLWIVAAKPVQFYYHYLLPAAFLMGCLALALDAVFAKGGRMRRAAALSALVVSLAMFAWFYPILSASELHDGGQSFTKWMWLDSWR